MGNYTVNMPKQAAWLVYINGLEIPAMSVSAHFGVWQLPTLTLELVPHPILTRIGAEDRLQVAVFYLDQHWEPQSPTFRLLGEYEVVGWSYRNTPRGRSVTLACVSQLQIFEQLKFFYISSLNDMTRALSASESSKGDVAQAVKVLYPASLFREGLTTPAVQEAGEDDGTVAVDANAYIKRPIDFVTNIFRALLAVSSPSAADQTHVDRGSKYVPKTSISVPGKNFFARWLKMTGFHRRWAAMPLLEDTGEDGCFPLIKATQDTSTLPALQQQIGDSVGESGTAWELLQQVLGHMYMEICAIPSPAAAITTKNSGRISPPWGNIATVSEGQVASIPTFFVKPMCTFALPPACNVIFPSMISQYTYQENYIRQPTRVYLGEQFISDVIAPPDANAEIANVMRSLLVTGYPVAVRKRMKDLATKTPETSNKNFLLYAEEFFKGPNSKQMNAPPWMYMLQQNMNGDTSESDIKEDVKAELDKEIADDLTSGLGAIFDAYAKSEYYRARYAERSGGVNILWNPYIVPGFPVAVFDQHGSGFDTMGYANSVSHNLTATGSMTTSVGLTFMRSMPEFVGITSEENQDLDIDIAPAEVIPEVRDTFQKATQAHILYRRLFYKDAPMRKSAVFNWKEMLDLVDSLYGNTLDPDVDAYRIDESVQLTPKDEFKNLFESYDAAMRYASRPGCSLKEYIEAWHEKSITTLLADNVVRGEYTSFYSPTNDQNQLKGATFWGRIYKLQQGPGNNPGVSVSNMGPGPDYASTGESNWDVVDTSQMPQTRANWDKKLEEYRKIVRSEDGKISPQV